MIPIRLTISGFLSYRDEVEVDFTTFDLACISGANGAGKSSLLDGMTWALFGQARKRDDSVINMQSDEAAVAFEFDYESNRYRVQRSKGRSSATLLEFQIQTPAGLWKPLTERTLRGTEAKIEETLRLDYETFVNASFFLQGKADQFTQQRPGDRKRILSSILGLDVWETYRKASVERRKVVDQEIAALDGRMQEISAELGEEDERKQRLKELEANLKALETARDAQEKTLDELRKNAAALAEQEKLVSTLAEQVDRAQANLNELNARLALRETEKAGFAELLGRAKAIEKEHKAWQAAKAELERWEDSAAKFREHEGQRAEPRTAIETERARLTAERGALRREGEAAETSATELKAFESQLKTLAETLKEVEGWTKKRERFERELEEARQAQADARAENPRLKAEMDELKERIDQLKATNGATCPLCGQPLTEVDRKRLIDELTEEGGEKGSTYRANTTLLKEADERVAGLESKIAGLKAQESGAAGQVREYEQVGARLEQTKGQLEAWEKDGKPQLAALEKQLDKEDFARDARKALAAIDAELKKIGYDAAQHDAMRKAEAEARGADDDLRKLEQAQAALTPLEREIEETRAAATKQAAEIEKQQASHAEAAAQLAAAMSGAPDVAAVEREFMSMQQQVNIAQREAGGAQQKVKVLDELRERNAGLIAEREELARQSGQYKALERAFGKDGVPAMLIEQALPQIEAKANEILERLSGGTMSIRFVTQAEYKDKSREDLKETLDIQISDAAGVRDYEMYSGGEAFRINFAIRLALSEVLAQRAGARLQTLVIDEGFGSQDEAGRQRLVEAINMVKDEFEKILVITHIDALKDVFPTRIEVLKTHRGSVVAVS
jgi:exonuclease SbcC